MILPPLLLRTFVRMQAPPTQHYILQAPTDFLLLCKVSVFSFELLSLSLSGKHMKDRPPVDLVAMNFSLHDLDGPFELAPALLKSGHWCSALTKHAESSWPNTISESGRAASNNRFPHSVVWTPLPIVSWLAPFLGHVGVCREDGVILDFAGSYYVNIDSFAFGAAARFVHLDEQQCCFPRYLSGHTCKSGFEHAQAGTALSWDDGLRSCMQHFQHKSYNPFTLAFIKRNHLRHNEGSLLRMFVNIEVFWWCHLHCLLLSGTLKKSCLVYMQGLNVGTEICASFGALISRKNFPRMACFHWDYEVKNLL
ncbi:hypothetical protein L7F22_008001 [Adiantum nelumboides]|nr:hypothetical protein [Adiantum nelumboides]